MCLARLKPGVTPARAEAEANAIFKAGLQSFYGEVTSTQRRRKLLDQRLKIRPGARGASETRSDLLGFAHGAGCGCWFTAVDRVRESGQSARWRAARRELGDRGDGSRWGPVAAG